MNFIILNGRKSTEVAGLMIQSLPPVTKPQMRVQLDQVDGRDGDIVTPLGYSGYDRTVKIGLRGVYDEDDIVQYFNSSGKVIFSNEPDKVYDYTIVESFSLSRLRRFREADIVFHVQPFKHSVVEEKTITASAMGNIATPQLPFNDTGLGGMISYSNGTFSVYGSIDTAYPQFEMVTTYTIETKTPITPGTYDVYLTVAGGAIVHGGFKVRIGFKYYDGHEFTSDQVVNSSSSGTVHLTIPVDELFETKYVSFVWQEDIIDGRGYATFQKFQFTDFKIMTLTGASMNVVNRGNTDSAPIFLLSNVVACEIRVNDGDPVTVDSSEVLDLTIDSEHMRAYSGKTLKNRLCSGNYANLLLKPGSNAVYVSGTVSSITISNYSRWI